MAEIIAYGSGEMLGYVFNGIAMLMNGQSGHFYIPILRMGAVVGGLWAFTKAFFDSSINGLLFQWMIPMMIVLGVCVVPTMSVTIIDVLAGGPLGAPITVDNVPLGLARAAQTISYVGHLVTKAVETAFHTPAHTLYNKTGMIFGAENLLEISRYAITDENLADNMREFVHNCVAYDLTLELYSIDDLKRAPDIWKLIAENTSNVRMFSLCTPKAAASKRGRTRPQSKKDRCPLKSCKEGAVELGALFDAYKTKFKTEHVMLSYLPQFYQQLTGIAKESQDFLSQQIMMHSIIDAVERKCEASGVGTNFAIRRAYLQQRNTYEVVGGLAAKSLVVLRNILEALIYAAFIFIIPFALMPMGFKVFLKWLWLLVWIQLWPPFYAILNSGIMTVTKHQAAHIPGLEKYGLTLLTSTGLHNLALDMQTYAAYASLSIPFLSYALLQGGISSLAQVAGAITGVAQSAGGAAAQDLTTGNYNYGNVQLENLSCGNQTMLQHNLAPSLTTGHTREDYGNYSVTNGENMIVNQRGSQLLSTINVSKGINQHLTDSATTSMERANREAESFSKTENESIQSMGSFTEHIASRKDYNHIYSQGSEYSMGETAQKTMEQVANWSKAHGVTTKKGFEILAKASISLPETEIGVGASASAAGTDEKTWQDAQSFAKTSSFSANYQALKTAAENQNVSVNDEKGTNLSKTISKQHEESQQHQQQYEYHKQQAEHFSRAAARVNTNALEINTNETQNFVKFLAEQKTSTGKPRGNMGALYIVNHSPKELEEGLQQFAAIKSPKMVEQYGIPTNAEFEKIGKTFKSPDTKQLQKLSQGTLTSRQEPTTAISQKYPSDDLEDGTSISAHKGTNLENRGVTQQSPWGKTQQHTEQKIVLPSALKNIDSEFNKMDKQLGDKENHIQSVMKERQTTVSEKLDQAKTTIPKHGENIKNKVKDEQNTSSIVRTIKAVPGVSTVIETVSKEAAIKKNRDAREEREFHKDLDDDPDRIKPTFKTDSKVNVEKEKK